MLNKIFEIKYEKYCFTINNTFHILYFLWICKKYKICNYLFLINNTNNFFIKWGYDKIFEKENINYIILKWEDSFRKFPLSIIDIIKYKIEVKKNLKNITWYKLIVSQDSTISNNIILDFLSLKDNVFLSLIDSTVYSIIKDNNKQVKYLLYKFYLKLLWINRWIKSWENFKYKNKLFSNNLDKNIIFDNIPYYKNIFSNKLRSLNNIKWDKNIIFLSQNIIDEYWIKKDNFINELIKVEKTYKNKWFDFHIKPHPLENTSYYENKFNLIDKSIPSELLDIYFWNKDTVYVTFFSTVINNLQFWKKFLIWNIGFKENETQIINMLNKDFNISFLNYE